MDFGFLGQIGNVFSPLQSISSIVQQQNWQRSNMEYQQANWEKQYKMINDYNNPKNVAKRYMDAGISPSAAFGGSTVGQSSASPALGSAGSPVGFPATMQNGFQMIGTIAQALQSLGGAFRNTVEGKSILSMLSEELRGLKLDNDQKSFLFNLDQQNLPKKQKIEIGKLFAEQQKLIAEANVANEDELLKIEQRYKMIAEKNRTLTENSILQKDLMNYDTNFQSILANRRAQNAANYGSAAEHKANAERESYFNVLRADPSAKLSLLTELRMKGKQAVENHKLTHEQYNMMLHEASKAAFSDNMKEFDYGWSRAMDICKGAGIIIKSVKPFGF